MTLFLPLLPYFFTKINTCLLPTSIRPIFFIQKSLKCGTVSVLNWLLEKKMTKRTEKLILQIPATLKHVLEKVANKGGVTIAEVVRQALYDKYGKFLFDYEKENK